MRGTPQKTPKAQHPAHFLAQRLKDLEQKGDKPFSQADLARSTGVSAQHISAILSKERGVSAEVALRLAAFFGDDPMMWLVLQAQWDLEQIRATINPARQMMPNLGDTMSSKYDSFWQGRFNSLGGVPHVLQQVRQQGQLILHCPEIRQWGARNTWSGHIVLANSGKIGGDIMAHTAALKNLIPKHLAPKEALSCRMSANCDFTLKLLAHNPVASRIMDTFRPASTLSASVTPLQTPRIAELWAAALKNPVPLFLTAKEDPCLALFDASGFFLSPEAQTEYSKIKDLPHIYTLRLVSENQYYFGKSNQPGGRFKRSHAYHLGGLAHELLGTTRYDDQRSHRYWIPAWFVGATPPGMPTTSQVGQLNAVRLKEDVVISFLQVDPVQLRTVESALIAEAKRQGITGLNRTA